MNPACRTRDFVEKKSFRVQLNYVFLSQVDTEVESGVLATLQRKEAQEKVLTEKWTEKWRETQQILQEQKALGLRKSGLGVVLDSDMPHLVGIDDNLLSTGVTLYHLKVGRSVFKYYCNIQFRTKYVPLRYARIYKSDTMSCTLNIFKYNSN